MIFSFWFYFICRHSSQQSCDIRAEGCLRSGGVGKSDLRGVHGHDDTRRPLIGQWMKPSYWLSHIVTMISTGWALVSPRPPELDHERGQDPARVSAGHQHGPRVPPPRQQGHLQVIHRDRLVWGVRREVRNKSYIGFINSVSNGWRIVNVNCKWGC